MLQTRAFTLLEMMLVLVVATILTTAGMVGIASVIREARYNADRARLYMDIKDRRDRARHSMQSLYIQEVTPTVVRFAIQNSCGPPAAGTFEDIEYPSIDSAADRTICNTAFGHGGVDTALDFIPLNPSGAPPTDTIAVRSDGGLVDSWQEFPDEGCLEANPAGGDPDDTKPCGD